LNQPFVWGESHDSIRNELEDAARHPSIVYLSRSSNDSDSGNPTSATLS
jgi:hypothetical protein